jgi:acylphosphatase
MKTRALVRVTGTVQGVAFRHYTAKYAERNQVTGWVRNLRDGSVQACFEGDEENVRAMVDWCRTGPRMASVERLSVEEQPYTGEFSGFSVRHDHD